MRQLSRASRGVHARSPACLLLLGAPTLGQGPAGLCALSHCVFQLNSFADRDLGPGQTSTWFKGTQPSSSRAGLGRRLPDPLLSHLAPANFSGSSRECSFVICEKERIGSKDEETSVKSKRISV